MLCAAAFDTSNTIQIRDAWDIDGQVAATQLDGWRYWSLANDWKRASTVQANAAGTSRVAGVRKFQSPSEA